MEKKVGQELRERGTSDCKPPPSQTSQYPWLVFGHQGSATFYSITENTSCVHSIPELGDKNVQDSSHGWLFLSKLDAQFSLWNPVTFESINLPPLEPKTTHAYKTCVLSSPPNHPDSMVFIFDNYGKRIWFCRLHEQHFSCAKYKSICQNINLPHERLEIDGHFFSSPVSCNNKIYAIAMESIIVQIEVSNLNRVMLKTLEKLPLPRRKSLFRYRKDLVESCEDLFVIYTICRGRHILEQVRDVEIHKLDLGSRSWERVTSIPNRTFFLDSLEHHAVSSSVICSESALGNQIYFYCIRNKALYSYHIEDQSLSASLPCPDSSDPQTLQGFPKWLMPHRSMGIRGEAGENIGKEANISSKKEVEGRDERFEIVEKESIGTKLVGLPLEILKSIHDCLSTIDYLNLRHASVVCRQAAPPLQFETAISRSEYLNNSLSPWLLSLHKDGRLCTLSHPHISDRYNVHVPQQHLQDAMLWHCKDGWLLVSNSRGSVHMLSFFNPFTKHIERYKELVEQPSISLQIAFSAPPTSLSCVIVTIDERNYGRSVLIRICRSKEEDWMEFLHSNTPFCLTYCNPIFSNGAFYFLGIHANVGVVRLLEEGCDWQVIERHPREIDSFFSESFLAERDGQVFLVLAYEMGKNVRVLSLDFSTLSWNNVESLGNYSLHVSKSSSLFSVAKNLEAENKIYFPRFYGDRLLLYSLTTNSIQCSGTKDSLESYKCSTLPLVCGWISPRWS